MYQVPGVHASSARCTCILPRVPVSEPLTNVTVMTSALRSASGRIYFEFFDEEFINSARKLFEINYILTILFTFHACLYQLSLLAIGPHHLERTELMTVSFSSNKANFMRLTRRRRNGEGLGGLPYARSPRSLRITPLRVQAPGLVISWWYANAIITRAR